VNRHGIHKKRMALHIHSQCLLPLLCHFIWAQLPSPTWLILLLFCVLTDMQKSATFFKSIMDFKI
jgi:hypothetical protein